MSEKIILITNKTSGHITNMLCIADDLKNNFEILFITSNNNHEINIIKKSKYNFIIYNNIFKIFKLFKNDNIKYVLSSGGRFSLPIISLAKSFNINTGIIEPNFFPGLAGFVMSHDSQYFCPNLEYKKLVQNFVHFNNPINKNFDNKINKNFNNTINKNFNNTINKNFNKTLLILGGTNGIKSLNTKIFDNLKLFKKNKIKLLWQTGIHYDYNIKNNDYLEIFKYSDNINKYYQKADLIISAAGINSIYELINLKKPFLLYPLKNSKFDHQKKNAIHINRYIENIYFEDIEELIPRILEIFKSEQNYLNLKKNYLINLPIEKNNNILNLLNTSKQKSFSILNIIKVIYFSIILYLKFFIFKMIDNKLINVKNIIKKNYIEYNKIPKELINSTILREDADYLNHNGYPLYFKTLLVYFIKSIYKKNFVLGGSGIVQQLLKNLFFEHTTNKFKIIKRKIFELVFTYFVDKFYTKEQILEYYFNVIYYIDYKNDDIKYFGLNNLSNNILKKNASDLNILESIITSILFNNPFDDIPLIKKDPRKLINEYIPFIIPILNNLLTFKKISTNSFDNILKILNDIIY